MAPIKYRLKRRLTSYYCYLILRKITKFVAARCQILRLKCTKSNFGWGSAPDPRGAYSLQRSPRPMAGFKGPTSKEREEKGRGGACRDEGPLTKILKTPLVLSVYYVGLLLSLWTLA